jgi:protein-L-isoaspartate(D-aspartate) O-methyltransferase
MTITPLEMNIEQARFNMIAQQIRPAEVLDERVLTTINETPRENFVPAAYKELAFSDINVPIGYGQVMMTPIMEARLLQALAVQPEDKILEVGTGSGYFTALLASLGGTVLSVEIHPELQQQAQSRLLEHGITNVTLMEGDASHGWDKDARYDVIAITGSFPILPETFRHQLNVGGRMVVIVGEKPVMEALLITRIDGDQWTTLPLFETDFPALENVEKPSGFVF